MKNSYIITQEQTETDERRGFITLRNIHLHNVQIVGMKLFLGGKEVVDYPDYLEYHKDLLFNIPKLYNVRTDDDGFLSFECGLDLLEDGRVWVNKEYFQDISSAYEYCKQKFGDFVITLEEPLPIRI